MIDLELSAADYQRYLNTLTMSHRIKVRVFTMTTEHKNIEEIKSVILNGQVAINADAQKTTRVLTAELLDPLNNLGWEAEDPTQGVMFSDRMIKVNYCVYVPNLSREDKWVQVPIFTGPISKMERNGVVVEVEASGKELLAQHVWKSFKIDKNTNKAKAIRDVMHKAGETNDFMSIYSTTGKMNATTVAYPKLFWGESRRIASSIDHYVFYDGRGVYTTKPYPESTDVAFVFSDGTSTQGNSQAASIVSDIDLSYDISEVKNTVKASGRKKGNKAAPTYTAYPPTDHILHPVNLGRNGEPMYLVEEPIVNNKYTTKAACKKAAQTRLDARLKTAINVKFDALPIPHLEPHDWVTLKTDRISHTFKMDEYTIPLTGSGIMSVGYIKRLNVSSTVKIKRRNVAA